MKIRWLTIEEINLAAKAGRKEAFLNCEHHWWQLSHATLDQYIKAPVKTHGDFCALCVRYTGKCNSCKLYCPLVWRRVGKAVCEGDPVAWKKATRAMHAHIVTKIHTFYPNLVIPKHKE